MLRTLIFTDY